VKENLVKNFFHAIPNVLFAKLLFVPNSVLLTVNLKGKVINRRKILKK
jgi:hypothetical protein